MQRNFLCALVIGAMLAFSTAALAQAPRTTSLSVTAEGSVLNEPDLAIVSLGVTTEHENSATAMAANATRMAALVQTLRSAGVAARDIQTSRLSLQPRYRSTRVRDLG